MMAENYKPVCSPAVIALVLSIFAFSSLLMPVALWFAVLAFPVALVAVWQIRRTPAAGITLAYAAMISSTALIVFVPARYYMRYLSEAPAGCVRLNFESVAQRKELGQYVGKSVCLKGFPIVDHWNAGTTDQLLFSHDGNRARLERAISVDLVQACERRLLAGPVAVTGILVRTSPHAPNTPKFRLMQAAVAPARTSVDLAIPAIEGC